MLRVFLLSLGLVLACAIPPAPAAGSHHVFGQYRLGESCEKLFSGPSFAVEKARPAWDPRYQMFGLEHDPDSVAKSRFILHYDRDEKPAFEGVPLGRIYYGCDKDSGRFSLIVMAHDLLAVPKLVHKATERFGPPTMTTMIQTIWNLPDLYVQIDQVFMIIYDSRAGKPGAAS
jgi:hypothetical protein